MTTGARNLTATPPDSWAGIGSRPWGARPPAAPRRLPYLPKYGRRGEAAPGARRTRSPSLHIRGRTYCPGAPTSRISADPIFTGVSIPRCGRATPIRAAQVSSQIWPVPVPGRRLFSFDTFRTGSDVAVAQRLRHDITWVVHPAGPRVRIPFAPAESQVRTEKPRFPGGVRAGVSGAVDRDAQGPATSR